MKYALVLLLILPVAAQDDDRLKGILERVKKLEQEVARLNRPATIDELLAAAKRGDAQARRELIDIRNRIDAVLRDAQRRRQIEADRKAAAAAERAAEVDALRARAEAARRDVRRRAEQAAPKQPDAPKGTADSFLAVLRRKNASMSERYNAVVNLARFPGAAPRKALVRVLENDKNDLVRRAAAWSLGAHKDAAAIPALIGQLDHKDAYVGHMCAGALTEITKKDFGFDATWELNRRVDVKKKWTAWYEANRAR